jgi:heterodisulfide reductase subunit B
MIPLRYPHIEMAIRKSFKNLGLEIVEGFPFTCCPDPIYFKARDEIKWLTIAARNLAIAEETGLPVLTVCSGCTSTLKEVRFKLNESDELKDTINAELKIINREYKGTVMVEHAVVYMRDTLGYDVVKATIKNPIENLRVAIHYGCHLLKPSQVMHVDDADYPGILTDLVAITGATPVRHQEQLLCCGKGCIDELIPYEMTSDIFDSVKESKADCLGLICPTCFSSFDLGQIIIARKLGKKHEIPVIYYFQLLGLAQGLSPEEVGLDQHRISLERILS